VLRLFSSHVGKYQISCSTPQQALTYVILDQPGLLLADTFPQYQATGQLQQADCPCLTHVAASVMCLLSELVLVCTAGNVVELILSIAALQAGLYDVVATSLLGSILSNLLLVLGMSFFVGGLK